MSLTRLPSGRWRAQVHVPGKGNVGVGRILGGKSTFATKALAKKARELARLRTGLDPTTVTVAEFAERWGTDPLFARPKESTNRHNRERVKAFVAAYGHLPLTAVDDLVVARWLSGGQRNATVPALRAMFNDAASAKAGRLVDRNPFAKLGISRGPGNRRKHPPSEETVWALVSHARELVCPSFGAWLQVAAFSGLRPGELDALRWTAVDLDRGSIRVAEQFSASTRTFTTPKNGQVRDAILTPPAREALIALPREEFCFTPLHAAHFTPSSRAYHWKSVRAAAGYTDTLYLATRHFFGWYAINVLELASEDVAIALGHTDGGELVRKLYGHRDERQALDRVAAAFDQAGRVQPLRVVREDSA